MNKNSLPLGKLSFVEESDLFIQFLLISFLWTFIYAPLQKEDTINSNHNNFQLF